MIVWDDLDKAIVGIGSRCGMQPCLVYDFDKLIREFSKQGMSQEDAEEWIVYNIEQAYVGTQTPILLRRMSQSEVAELLEGIKDE